MTTRQEMAKILAVFEAADLPRQNGKSGGDTAEALRLDVWFMQFSDVPYVVLNAAAAQYIRSGRWFPTPADIHAIIDEARRMASPAPTAAEAWQLLGRSRSYDDLPSLVTAALERFGSQRFRERLTEDEGTNFAQFRGIYEALVQRADYADTVAPQMARLLAPVMDRLRLPAPVRASSFDQRRIELMTAWARNTLDGVTTHRLAIIDPLATADGQGD